MEAPAKSFKRQRRFLGFSLWGVVYYALFIAYGLLSNVLCFVRYFDSPSAPGRTVVFVAYVAIALAEVAAVSLLLIKTPRIAKKGSAADVPGELSVFAVAAALHFGAMQINSLFAELDWIDQLELFNHYEAYKHKPIGVLQLQVDAVFLCLAVGHLAISVARQNTRDS